jgi:hypothetical protein
MFLGKVKDFVYGLRVCSKKVIDWVVFTVLLSRRKGTP